MPDFESTGLWDQTQRQVGNGWHRTGGMIEYSELKLSHELIDNFETWIRYYDRSFTKKYDHMRAGRAQWLNQAGKELAREIKKKFPKVVVTYWGETRRGFKKEEVIQSCTNCDEKFKGCGGCDIGGCDSWTPSRTHSEIPAPKSFAFIDRKLVLGFIDRKARVPTSWYWDFGDGSTQGTTQNPTHTKLPPRQRIYSTCGSNICWHCASVLKHLPKPRKCRVHL